MGNQINVSYCDNELVLIAYQWGASYVIGHIQSGNLNKVDVTIDLVEGEYKAPQVINGVNKPLDLTTSVALPKGEYTLVYSGINWGGPYGYEFHINGKKQCLPTVSKVPEGQKDFMQGAVWNLGYVNNENLITFKVE